MEAFFPAVDSRFSLTDIINIIPQKKNRTLLNNLSLQRDYVMGISLNHFIFFYEKLFWETDHCKICDVSGVTMAIDVKTVVSLKVHIQPLTSSTVLIAQGRIMR